VKPAIRPETPADAAEIRALLEAAFPTAAEARLVERLHADGDAVLGLVVVEMGRIAGYALFSRLEAPFKALALAPVAVAPGRQRQGLGTHLIREGLARAWAEGWKGAFVLGDYDFYGRFGFEADLAEEFASPYAGPNFLALSLGGGPLPAAEGAIGYAPAFAALD
jgi:putative acetyltransferase